MDIHNPTSPLVLTLITIHTLLLSGALQLQSIVFLPVLPVLVMTDVWVRGETCVCSNQWLGRALP
jgi:hypothetical protein